jgi:condensin complex subunit 1
LTAEPALKASALLALTKLMVVDATICENNLQLLFTFLQNRVVDPSIRSNLVVALGDLALRFPNLIEPWTEHVYRTLGDPDVGVRKTAMMVLTHLILNDMMKVKGHIAKMAVCLEDSDERVAALASLFFHELAKKEYKGTSPIYNLLPDMLSMLSKDSTLNRSQFQSVMQQLLAHIKKDKQGDALVEKLCQRFASTEDESQWRNVAFCIIQLPISDKGIKKLVEGFNFYKNALADEETAGILLSIVAKAKKNASKPESKELIEDLESKMVNCIEEWDEINGTSRKVKDEEKSEHLDESVIEGMDRLGLEEGETLDSNGDEKTKLSQKDGRKSLPEQISGKENQRVNQDEEDDSNLIAAVQAMAVE